MSQELPPGHRVPVPEDIRRVGNATAKAIGRGAAEAAAQLIEVNPLRPFSERPTVVASGGCPDDSLSRKWRKGRFAMGYKTEAYWRIARRDQGLPEDFDLPPFTIAAKIRAVGNGVPLPMGRAIARAVRQALGLPVLTESTEGLA